MASGQFATVFRRIRHMMGGGTSEGLTDGQLLERFAGRQEEAAFESLLERHGPMVLGLCRSILHDAHDADDAFQATFLVLARKAGSIRKQQSVASWLYGVALRTALRARSSSARRRTHERQVPDMPRDDEIDLVGRQELRSVVAEELQRLPEKYRAPLVLCYLEGKTNETAAAELGWPMGSMSKRLARARDLLKERLAYRGVAMSVGLIGTIMSECGAQAATVPPALAAATVQSALLYAAGKAGAVSTQAAALADGVMQTMGPSRFKLALSLLLMVGLAGGGAGLLAYQTLNRGAADRTPIQLPADAREAVVTLDVRGGLLPRTSEEPLLVVQADGTAIFGNPQGQSQKAQARLDAEQLQELLRYAIREKEAFGVESLKLEEAVRAEAARKGLRPIAKDAPTTILRIKADGKDHEIRVQGLNEALVRRLPEVRELANLLAIQQRLDRLATWVQAGGKDGVEAIVQSANVQLHKEFPQAPQLTAEDLQSAQLRDGQKIVTLERRGVAAKDPFSFVYVQVEKPAQGEVKVTVKANLASVAAVPPPVEDKEPLYLEPINMVVPSITTDATVKYDYDIVYVRMPRYGDIKRTRWTDISQPALMEPSSDLMLLRPDGTEEVLVAGGADGAVTDPMVSLDGEWVYYSHIKGLKGTSPHGQPPTEGADIYKVHVRTKQVVQLTHQEYTPNTGAANWSSDIRKGTDKGKAWLTYGVLNMGPCPLPGGKIAFTSNRNAFIPPKHPSPCQQLFIMDEDGSNVEQIGYLNIGMALHPVVLADGRIMFSSLESQGVRNNILWGLWVINPDGTNWGPLVSAFDPVSAPNAFHFQSQLSDGSLIVQEYYNQNNSSFGAYIKMPPAPPDGVAGFGPGYLRDPRNTPMRFGRHDNGRGQYYRLPFTPYGAESFTRFALNGEGPANRSIRGDKTSPAVGKFTHPAGAPDNHLLTCYSPGPANHQYSYPPEVDGGIYLIKSGKPIDEPAQMLLIKNDPNYNEQWPRAVVPYKRIYGIDEPKRLTPLANDGKLSPHLPEGTPFGLVGTSSFYKRESYPNGVVPPGSVTAGYAGGNDPYKGLDPFNTSENGATLNWFNQGADAGIYSNSDIHAVRILAMEPTTDRKRGNYPRDGRLFRSHAMERLRILGEIPLRKFGPNGQPEDPDGNPDTSFLARIPADVAFTFQTLDKDGMVLNMAQTWHQLRPGEIRNDCGGCHAHSQKPTAFEKTAAARKDYQVFDLTRESPLLTTKANDQSGKQWDAKDETGVRFEKGIMNVEYFRDIQPILARSCVACHTKKSDQPAGNLVLDDDDNRISGLPGTYFRLAEDGKAQFGHKPVIHNGEWRNQQATRYVRMFQARRSLLTWKVWGKRTDGWSNDDFPSETIPGDPNSLVWKGQKVANTQPNRNLADLDYLGTAMPPPEAVAGTYVGPKGDKIKVQPLTDEDRRTIVRWIDLGCPIDLDYDPANPERRGYGWMCDDNRPTLNLTTPVAGVNPPITRLLVGMHDYYTGLDPSSFTVTADFAIDGVAAGVNLASKFKARGDGIWELTLATPVRELPRGKLTVSVKDRGGNISKIERSFSVAGK